jgi:hypothetical protein
MPSPRGIFPVVDLRLEEEEIERIDSIEIVCNSDLDPA